MARRSLARSFAPSLAARHHSTRDVRSPRAHPPFAVWMSQLERQRREGRGSMRQSADGADVDGTDGASHLRNGLSHSLAGSKRLRDGQQLEHEFSKHTKRRRLRRNHEEDDHATTATATSTATPSTGKRKNAGSTRGSGSGSGAIEQTMNGHQQQWLQQTRESSILAAVKQQGIRKHATKSLKSMFMQRHEWRALPSPMPSMRTRQASRKRLQQKQRHRVNGVIELGNRDALDHDDSSDSDYHDTDNDHVEQKDGHRSGSHTPLSSDEDDSSYADEEEEMVAVEPLVRPALGSRHKRAARSTQPNYTDRAISRIRGQSSTTRHTAAPASNHVDATANNGTTNNTTHSLSISERDRRRQQVALKSLSSSRRARAPASTPEVITMIDLEEGSTSPTAATAAPAAPAAPAATAAVALTVSAPVAVVPVAPVAQVAPAAPAAPVAPATQTPPLRAVSRVSEVKSHTPTARPLRSTLESLTHSGALMRISSDGSPIQSSTPLPLSESQQNARVACWNALLSMVQSPVAKQHLQFDYEYYISRYGCRMLRGIEPSSPVTIGHQPLCEL